MKATFLEEIKTSRAVMETFGGYDARTRISEGSFAKECNLTSRHYPLMATRDPRAVLAHVDGLQGLLLKDKFAWIAGGKLYYDGSEIPDLTFLPGEKIMLSMGALIVVFPDRISYNTVTGACEWNDKFFVKSINSHAVKESIYIDPAEMIGKELHEYDSIPDGSPKDPDYVPKVGDYVYYQIPGTDEMVHAAEEKARVYYRLNEERKFEPVTSDQIIYCVTILNYDPKFDLDGNTDEKIKLDADLSELEGIVFLKKGDTEHFYGTVKQVERKRNGVNHKISFYIHLSGVSPISSEDGVSGEWTVEYLASPDLDGVLESGNRLWGCRYGEAWNGEFVNEIYATALGSPDDWNTMEGIASDAYAASCGSDGPFTGAIYYSGSLYFFKETGFHRVTGTQPSNFQVSFFSCRGVEEGSERSLVLHGDALYYKGVDGIYRYDGSVPYKISEALGDKRYRNAVAGVLGDRIYFEMEDETGARSVFVYDVARGLWNVERAVGALRFVPAFGNLVYMTEDTIGLMSGEGIGDDFLMFESIEREAPFSWFGEFGDFGLADPDAKYISKLQLRMEADEGARVTVEVMCDSDGSWETLAVMDAGKKQSRILPVVIRRCDHFRLRISGVGGFRLWTLTKEMESTNEVRA